MMLNISCVPIWRYTKKKIFSIFKMLHRFYVYQIQVIQTSRVSWGSSLVTIPLSHSLTCSEGSLSRVYPASTLWQVSTSPTSNRHLETWKKMNDRPYLVRNPFLVIISNNHYPVNCYLLTGERTKPINFTLVQQMWHLHYSNQNRSLRPV